MENVVMVLFEIGSEAYQALSELKNNAVNSSYTISQVGLINKQHGRIMPCEGFDSGIDTWDDTLKGSLIGGLVGILGGPIGILLGGSVGVLVGSAVDLKDTVRNVSMLEKVSEKLQDNQVALVALIQENDETAFDNKVSKYKTEIMRWDAAVIAEEVEEAEKLEKEMRHVAREKLREQKKEERKQDLEQTRNRIHAEIEAFKEKFKKKM